MQHALKNNQLTFGSAIKVYILLHLSHLFQMQISNTSKGVIMTVLVININFVSVCLAAHYLLENTCDLFLFVWYKTFFFDNTKVEYYFLPTWHDFIFLSLSLHSLYFYSMCFNHASFSPTSCRFIIFFGHFIKSNFNRFVISVNGKCLYQKIINQRSISY